MTVTPKEPPQIAWKNRRREDPEARMTFIEHLGELRSRIVRSAIAILIGTVFSYIFYDYIFAAVTRPLMPVQEHREELQQRFGMIPVGEFVIVAPMNQVREATRDDLVAAGIMEPLPEGEPEVATPTEGESGADAAPPAVTPPGVAPAPATDTAGADPADPTAGYFVLEPRDGGPSGTLLQQAPIGRGEPGEKMSWVVLNPLEGFMMQFKLSILFGMFFASPYLVFQICAFVFPGLNKGERSAAMYLIAGSSVLSLTGVSVAYFLIFPNVLPYLLAWTPPGVFMQLRVNETIPFLLKSVLGFAVAFQFPMVVLLLVYLDLMSPQSLKQHRRVAIVIVCIVSAVLTPPDPGSLLMMALPLMLLYEVSIWLSHLVVFRRKKRAAGAG